MKPNNLITTVVVSGAIAIGAGDDSALAAHGRSVQARKGQPPLKDGQPIGSKDGVDRAGGPQDLAGHGTESGVEPASSAGLATAEDSSLPNGNGSNKKGHAKESNSRLSKRKKSNRSARERNSQRNLSSGPAHSRGHSPRSNSSLNGSSLRIIKSSRKANRTAPRSNSLIGPTSPFTNGSAANAGSSLGQGVGSSSVSGLSNYQLQDFRIPPFLLPIYQAAGTEYGVQWEILAAINELETNYGRDLSVSTAGAVGWMQFLPSTWEQYGVDANNDGIKDPYDPREAIFSAAHYLQASGIQTDVRRALYAYNHADWYVNSVLLRARQIASIPPALISSLTGLAEGHFPVYAAARYGQRSGTSKGANRSIEIFSRPGSPVVAVNDGEIVQIGRSRNLGRFVRLQDVYGNIYTYSHMGELAKRFLDPAQSISAVDELAPIEDDAELESELNPSTYENPFSGSDLDSGEKGTPVAANRTTPRTDADPSRGKERLFADPRRANSYQAGGEEQIVDQVSQEQDFATFNPFLRNDTRPESNAMRLRPLRKGVRVIAGTVLGHVGRASESRSSHIRFDIRPAGTTKHKIDPKPFLDGWNLLEQTATGPDDQKLTSNGSLNPSVGQLMLMSKELLIDRVLSDPNIEIYPCGRADVQNGQIDRRVLATLAFLSSSGLHPSVTSLRCGHSLYTKSGNVSAHASGNAVDISKVNGIPIAGNQTPGSITDQTIQRLLSLQGNLRPHQIISLRAVPNSPAMAMQDHWDHIHVGFQPGGSSVVGGSVQQTLKPQEWDLVMGRLNAMENPVVKGKPSKYAIPAAKK